MNMKKIILYIEEIINNTTSDISEVNRNLMSIAYRTIIKEKLKLIKRLKKQKKTKQKTKISKSTQKNLNKETIKNIEIYVEKFKKEIIEK